MLQLLEDVVALKAENAALREEIARLKGLKGPPKLKPSGMEKATEPARAERKAGRRGGKIDRLVIDEERVLKAAVPPGSRFKGYETQGGAVHAGYLSIFNILPYRSGQPSGALL